MTPDDLQIQILYYKIQILYTYLHWSAHFEDVLKIIGYKSGAYIATGHCNAELIFDVRLIP